mmetsp:Transcript_22158/g.68052  ORF Transcript_22158/g.68052 Transcript_22158/m.68052 type:complete len:218 (-) Transcript_22158:103-756(-)
MTPTRSSPLSMLVFFFFAFLGLPLSGAAAALRACGFGAISRHRLFGRLGIVGVAWHRVLLDVFVFRRVARSCTRLGRRLPERLDVSGVVQVAEHLEACLDLAERLRIATLVRVDLENALVVGPLDDLELFAETHSARQVDLAERREAFLHSALPRPRHGLGRRLRLRLLLLLRLRLRLRPTLRLRRRHRHRRRLRRRLRRALRPSLRLGRSPGQGLG